MNILPMVQLLDSTPEAGGYAECFQLEHLIAVGKLSQADQVENFIIRALKTAIGPLEGFATGAVFEASRRGNFSALPALARELCTSHAPESLQRASLNTGRQIWETSRRWTWAVSIHDQLDEVTELTGHFYAVVFGALISDATAQRARAVAACLLSTVRSLVFCAARYLPMDAIQSQRMVSDIQPTISQLALAYSQPDAIAPPISDPAAVIAQLTTQ